LEEQIPSAKSVKTHLQKVKKPQSIENYHLSEMGCFPVGDVANAQLTMSSSLYLSYV